MHARIPAGLLLSLVALISSGHAQTGRPSALNLHDAGKKIADVVHQIVPNERELFVREFRATGSSDVGLAKVVGDALKSLGHSVKPGAKVEIEGRLVRLPAEEASPLKGFSVNGQVVLASGSERKFSVDVLNADEGAARLGETGELSAPPTANDPAPNKDGPVIRGNEILPSARSPYSLEILTETASGQLESKQPILEGNLVYVNLRPGEIYAVRLHNRSKFEAATAISIDGLSRFALADDPKRQNGLDLVRWDQPRTIPGYFRDGQTVDAFQIGEYSKSPAAKLLPSPSDVGTITVTFAAAWERGQDPPPNEPSKLKAVNYTPGHHPRSASPRPYGYGRARNRCRSGRD